MERPENLLDETLQLSEDRIRLIIDTIPTMVWTLQPDGSVDFFNQRWLNYGGKSEEVMKDPSRVIHPDDRSRALENWSRNMAKGKPTEDEMRLLGIDGVYRWFLIHTAPLQDAKGKVVKWYGVAINIDERKQLGEALRESEHRYTSLFENMSESVSYFQVLFSDGKLQDAIYLDVNQAYERLTGFKKSIIGRKLSEVVPGGMAAVNTGVLERSAKVALTGQSDRFEVYSNILKKWLSVSAYCPKKEHVIMVLDDITERKEAEVKLQLAYKSLSYHVDNTPLAVIEFDKDLFVKRWSKRAEEIFGWKTSEAVGKNMYDADFRIIYNEDISTVDSIHEELMKGKVNGNVSLNRNYTRSGDVIHCEWYNSILRDDHGNVITILSLVHDVTERQEAEEKLQQLNGELRSLSSHLHHVQENERTAIAREIHDELGQLLTGLKMEVGWLTKRLPDEQILVEKGKEIMSIVSDLLKTVKKIAIDLRPNILDELGLIAAIEWQGEEFEKGRGIKFQFHTNLDDFNPDRDLSTNIFRVHQEALTNIARHAQASKIETTLERHDEWLQLTIKDNGKGFDVGEKKNKKSFGLIGMKERALMLHGELIIESAKRKGTVITLRVPLMKTKPTE